MCSVRKKRVPLLKRLNCGSCVGDPRVGQWAPCERVISLEMGRPGLRWKTNAHPAQYLASAINEKRKTGNSKKTVPLHDLQIGILLDWRRASPYNQPGDWVFASPQMQGKQPFWPERLRKNLQGVVKRLGINKRVGWHTFRHTLSTMLRANGEDIATQAELLRNSQRVALEHYTQAIPESKRAAQARVLTLIFGEDSANGTFRHMAVSPTIN